MPSITGEMDATEAQCIARRMLADAGGQGGVSCFLDSA